MFLNINISLLQNHSANLNDLQEATVHQQASQLTGRGSEEDCRSVNTDVNNYIQQSSMTDSECKHSFCLFAGLRVINKTQWTREKNFTLQMTKQERTAEQV